MTTFDDLIEQQPSEAFYFWLLARDLLIMMAGELENKAGRIVEATDLGETVWLDIEPILHAKLLNVERYLENPTLIEDLHSRAKTLCQSREGSRLERG